MSHKCLVIFYLVLLINSCTSVSKLTTDQLSIKQYQSLAENGNAEAQNNLGVIYRKGGGVAQDLVTAYMWTDLAATQHNKNAIENKTELDQIMDQLQIKLAKEMSKECLKSKYKNCAFKKIKPTPGSVKIKTVAHSLDNKIEIIEKEPKKIPIGINIDKFKVQCKALGFKVGTTDYGNCVLQLNESK